MMGTSSSTRRLTVVNDSSMSNVILISDSVARKLKGESDGKQQHQSTPSPSSSQLTSSVMQQQQQAQEQTNSKSQLSHSGDPYLNYFSGASDNVTLRQKHDAEIRHLEQTWKSQINMLEKQNDELYKTLSTKFATDIADIESKYVKKRCEPVCVESEKKVIACYQSNKSQPLKCSPVVREFQQCVRSVRKDIFNRQV